MKILLAIFLALLTLNSTSALALAPPTIAARSWILFDVTSHQTLAAREPHLRIEPASLTKLMTAYLVFEAIKDGKLRLNQEVKVSPSIWKLHPEAAKMFIDPALPVTVEDLLLGLIVQSANDAAIALAEAVDKNEAAFVERMNRTAIRLGLTATHFANSHGQTDAKHYSTARDLSVLALQLITEFPDHYKIFSTKNFSYNKISQSNRNRLLWLESTVDGMKTGQTNAAGYSLIASAIRPNGEGSRRLLSVVIGADSDLARTQESQKLLNWGFLNFDMVKLYPKNQTILSPSVWKGSQATVPLGFNYDVYVSLPRGMLSKIKPVIERPDPLIAPITQYSRVGTLKIMGDGKVLVELPLQALEQVNPASLLGRLLDSLRMFFH
jgi:D-alanyl-D-alanine carboxypeptidase (penicillin-binding protein 5/6)